MSRQTLTLSCVWMVLVAATLLTWSLGYHANDVALHFAPKIAVTIIVVAFAKVALVLAYFMELRWAPYVLCGIAAIWVIVECVILVWLFTG